MKAEYDDVFFLDGVETLIGHKTIEMPFRRVSARGIIFREKDGAVVGSLHHVGGSYALPGGAVDDGENTHEALMRELQEENIVMEGLDPNWMEKIVVDCYPGYYELTLWYIVIVQDAKFQACEEVVETRWIHQDEDVWYPGMRTKIILALNQYVPELVKNKLQVVIQDS